VKKFLLPEVCPGPARLTLGPHDSRYLTRVLRLQEGDTLAAGDAQGGAYTLTIRGTGRGGCVVDVVPLPPQAAPSAGGSGDAPVSFTLLQCLPKGRKIDLIIRQATEAGVARIIPLVSAHTVVRPGEDGDRSARLLRVAREAVQQSGAPRLPRIDPPRDLRSLADSGEAWGTALVFDERPGGAETLHRVLADAAGAVSVLIGPEGGLSEGEVAMLVGAGFHRVHLRTGVLRVETAALVALGAVMTIVLERNEWKPAAGA
jgi:16S rRNA (uracil1498-N3)-methyltransferase